MTNSKDFNIKYLHSIYIPIEVPPTLIHFASDADRQTKNEMNSFLVEDKNTRVQGAYWYVLLSLKLKYIPKFIFVQ